MSGNSSRNGKPDMKPNRGNTNKPFTGEVTEEMIEEFIKDLQAANSKDSDVSHREKVTIPETIGEFDDYIKEGFLYMLRNESGVVYGGYGFVKEVYEVHKEHGLPDWMFYIDVFVTDDNGLKFSTRWNNVLEITWTPVKKS